MKPQLAAAIRDQHEQRTKGDKPAKKTARKSTSDAGRRTKTPAKPAGQQAAESADQSDTPQPKEN